mgnify:CR=1 FL=1
MSLVTKFAARDPGPAARMAGFVAHLRDNGLRLGVGETGIALDALTHINAANPHDTRRALKSIFTGCAEEAAQFDGLFNSFWMNGGRVKSRVTPTSKPSESQYVHSSREASAEADPNSGAGDISAPDGGDGEAQSDGEGKLVATDVANLFKKDLRPPRKSPCALALPYAIAGHGAAKPPERGIKSTSAKSCVNAWPPGGSPSPCPSAIGLIGLCGSRQFAMSLGR